MNTDFNAYVVFSEYQEPNDDETQVVIIGTYSTMKTAEDAILALEPNAKLCPNRYPPNMIENLLPHEKYIEWHADGQWTVYKIVPTILV